MYRPLEFVVADFTHGPDGKRGSIYYEVGLVRGQEKSVILTAREDLVDSKKIVFELKHYSII